MCGRPLVNTLNLADLIPTSTILLRKTKSQVRCSSERRTAVNALCYVREYAIPTYLHVRDLGHAFMFGPTCAGKSTHLALIAACSGRRYADSRIFTFDKGLSMLATCGSVGGKHFTIAGDDNQLAFALYHDWILLPAAWAMEWIEAILILNGG